MSREHEFTEFLAREYLLFVDAYSLNSKDFNMDLVVLYDVCKRYFRDVDRLHRYHGISRINSHKIAGYLSYWIAKLRPISVVNPLRYNTQSEFCLYINEVFAVRAVTGRLISASEIKNTRVSDSFLSSFLYLLKYRHTTGDNLTLLYYLVDELHAKNTK